VSQTVFENQKTDARFRKASARKGGECGHESDQG
jgi:hypothetical protein